MFRYANQTGSALMKASRILVIAGTMLLPSLPSATLAQTDGRPINIRLDVRDSSGRALSGVSVSISVQGLVSRGVTNDSGAIALRMARSDRYSVSIRKVGYAPINSSVVTTADTAVRLVMVHVADNLDTVRVLAEQTARQRAYHIAADEIAQSSRVLIDGFDIVSKLRPDIAWGRGFCGGAANIWVNGRWIPPELVATNDIANARANRGNAEGRVSRTVLYVMSEIKPEHIDELTYHDCHDQSVGGLHGEAALFVILKPGVEFDPGRGSFVRKR